VARRLFASEEEFLETYFGSALRREPVRVALSIGRRCWSPYGNRISLTRHCFDGGDPRAAVRLDEPSIAAVFAHEALHVWQRQHRVWVTLRGAVLQAGYVLRIADPYLYTPHEDPAVMLSRFTSGNIERQGRIFEDYVREQQSERDASRFALVASHVRSALG
jgi:hypothetical protein